MFYVYADGELMYHPACTDGTRMILDPNLKLEMGGAGVFDFSLPVTNIFYDEVRPLTMEIAVTNDDRLLFVGRIAAIERDFDNTKRISCEGLMSFLSDSVQQTTAFEGTTHELFSLIIERHNRMVEPEKQFEIGDITIDDREIIISGVSENELDEDGNIDYDQIYINATSNDWTSPLDLIDSQLISYCGGYLRARREDGINYIDLLRDNYGRTSAQNIRFGINILELTETVSIDDLFTVLIPLGDENLTIETVNEGSIEISDPELVEKYGRIIKTNVFDSVSKPETLLENALRFYETNAKITREIVVNAVDMHLVDASVDDIRCGDVVHVDSAPHGITGDFACTEIDYDFNDPSNNQYTFGQPQQTLTQRYKQNKKKSRGGGGSAAEAVEQVDQQRIKDFYDAWVNWEEGTASVSLGAVYKKVNEQASTLENIKYIFTSEMGIDMDAPTGLFNLHTMRTDLNEAQNNLRTYGASISLMQQHGAELQAGIDMVTQFVDYQKKEFSEFVARYRQESDDVHASIELLVGDTVDAQEGIKLFSERLDDAIHTTTTINTKVTNIQSEVTRIKNLVAETITADYLKSNVLVTAGLSTKTVIATDMIVSGNINAQSSTAYMGTTYIKELYVDGKAAATQEWVKSMGYASQNWVQSQGYLTSAKWALISGKPTMVKRTYTDPSGNTVNYWGW